MVATMETTTAGGPSSAAGLAADTFSVLVESNYCLNPACESLIPAYSIKHEYSPNGLLRTTTAVCQHCKRRHTANSVLEGGIWRVKGVFFDDPPSTRQGGLVERIDAAQGLEHDRDLLRGAMARMETLLARARAALDAGQPLSPEDRKDLERLDTDCDVAAPAVSPGSLGERIDDVYCRADERRDQASKLRELTYTTDDPTAPPADLSVRGDVPYGD